MGASVQARFQQRDAKVACQAMGFTSAAGFYSCDGALCGRRLTLVIWPALVQKAAWANAP